MNQKQKILTDLISVFKPEENFLPGTSVEIVLKYTSSTLNQNLYNFKAIVL